VSDLQVGDTVMIDGLKAAADLNGSLAKLEEWESEVGRWRVCLASSEEAKRVKPENLTKVDEAIEEADVDEPAKGKQARKAAKPLHADVQDIVERICDAAMMRRHVADAGFDESKMPLHSLNRPSIKEGLTWLRAIEQELLKPTPRPESLTLLSQSFFQGR
jgi:hypothetical protein